MTQTPTLEIVHLVPTLREALCDLFAEIEQNGDSVFFHPHPFSVLQAEHLCNHVGKDCYYAILRSSRILGYGMLRGWDAGYAVPSLGIYIRREARGKGLGKLLMLHLHTAALISGAERVRLKVRFKNEVARRVYEKLGYTFQVSEGEHMVGFCYLCPTGSFQFPSEH
jgi:GNAT superfamily N-acetyltransferase